MAMNQAEDFSVFEGVENGVLINIHDLHCFTLLVETAFEAIPASIEFSHPKRLTECIGSPLWGADPDSRRLVAQIISTQKIAVHQECRRAIEIYDGHISQQFDTRFAAKVFTD